MAVVVTTPAANQRLANPATIATELNTADDLTAMVDQVSDMIAAWLGRVLIKETVTETSPGSDRYRLVLSRTPVNSVSAVRLDGTTQTLADFVVEDSGSGFLFHRQTFQRWSRGARGASIIPLPEEPRHVWEVDYVGGYVLSGATGDEVNLPSVFYRAVLMQVKHLRALLSASGDLGMKSESWGDYNYTRADAAESGSGMGSGGLLAQVQEMLRPYQRVVCA